MINENIIIYSAYNKNKQKKKKNKNYKIKKLLKINI